MWQSKLSFDACVSIEEGAQCGKDDHDNHYNSHLK